MTSKILFQGAEAVISKQRRHLVKNRIKKTYRHPELDNKIRIQRTRKEAKLLDKASKIIQVPKIINVTPDKIVMEEIKGKRLADCLDKIKKRDLIANKIGLQLAKIHQEGIIHGDLTTSNLILSKTAEIYFIDFGLGFESNNAEDKAVDLHVLKEALDAKHPKISEQFFKAIIKNYKKSPQSKQVMERLEKVELRGRYKQQY